MIHRILVERSEWFVCDAEDVTFVNIDDGTIINGEQWLSLGDEQANYMLNTNQASEVAIDGGTEHFDVREYKENE